MRKQNILFSSVYWDKQNNPSIIEQHSCDMNHVYSSKILIFEKIQQNILWPRVHFYEPNFAFYPVLNRYCIFYAFLVKFLIVAHNTLVLKFIVFDFLRSEITKKIVFRLF
jgi:hypothetical protein